MENKLDGVLEREQKELQKAANLLGKNVYGCAQDAQMANDAFLHEHRFWEPARQSSEAKPPQRMCQH
ncbi:MAG: hypothetical protein K6T30_09975 [Alicyclobacillus sp.]|nr:hypothetical protein [Alicyclobacillus sp.]